jgi:hypothetical protein
MPGCFGPGSAKSLPAGPKATCIGPWKARTQAPSEEGAGRIRSMGTRHVRSMQDSDSFRRNPRATWEALI